MLSRGSRLYDTATLRHSWYHNLPSTWFELSENWLYRAYHFLCLHTHLHTRCARASVGGCAGVCPVSFDAGQSNMAYREFHDGRHSLCLSLCLPRWRDGAAAWGWLRGAGSMVGWLHRSLLRHD